MWRPFQWLCQLTKNYHKAIIISRSPLLPIFWLVKAHHFPTIFFRGVETTRGHPPLFQYEIPYRSTMKNRHVCWLTHPFSWYPTVGNITYPHSYSEHILPTISPSFHHYSTRKYHQYPLWSPHCFPIFDCLIHIKAQKILWLKPADRFFTVL